MSKYWPEEHNKFYEKLIKWANTLFDNENTNKDFDLTDDECSKYAIDVINHKILTSKYVYLICLQHFLFLYKSKYEQDFKFKYYKSPLKKIVKFASHIIVPEINAPFIFPSFRKFMSGYIWGWRYINDNKKLMVQNIFDVEARKQWKSSFWAMVMLAVMLGVNNDYNAEIYISGPQAETSKIPFNTARNYISKTPKLHSFFHCWNSIHIRGKAGGIIKPLAFEKAALEGKNSSMVILTEYHLHKNDEMQESAQSGRNTSRKNPLIIYDTTKGHNIDSVCFNREQTYKKFLQNQIDNPYNLEPNFDVFLWAAELDEEDYNDWENPELWIKANPNLDISVTKEQLLQEFYKIDSKAAEIEFKTKRLGMWVNAATAYFSLFEIMESDEIATAKIQDYINDPEMLKQCKPVFGVDLSNIHDTTHLAVGFEIPQEDGDPIWYFQGMGYIPEPTAWKKEQHDKQNYNEWRDSGYLTFTPKEVIDYSYIVNDIKKWKQLYNVTSIAYDPFAFNIIKEHLINNHIYQESQVVAIKQGIQLSPYFKEFERKLRLKKIAFNNNQMLIQHTANISIKPTQNANDNLLIQKISSNKRIDALMSILNIIAHWKDKQKTSSETGKIYSLFEGFK